MIRARPASHSSADLLGSLVRRHGADLPISEIVRSSWSRCVNNYALDPYERRRPHRVDEADLRARRERLGVLLDIARIEMEALGKLIRHSEYSIVLTDLRLPGRDGIDFLKELQRRNLKRGIAALCLGGGNAVALAVERA